MKKHFKKLAIFTIISLFLNVLIMGISTAQTTTADVKEDKLLNSRDNGALEGALDDLIGKECFDYPTDEELTEEDFNFNDYPILDYLITTIEEPLETESNGTIGEDDIVSLVCYRNVFFYFETYESGNQLERVLSEPALATECSDRAQELVQTKSLQKYNPSFRCKKVQVFLTKGGTTTLQAYITTIYRWGASVAGLIAVVVIILNGIRISIAGGDTQAIENAKTRILQSIGGLVLLFLSGLLLYTINPNFFVR